MAEGLVSPRTQGDRFEGVVTGVAPFGLFVRLSEVLVDGLVRVDRLGDDWFDHSPTRHELRGRKSGKRFRLGDRMEVVVTRVDPALRRIDLLPAARPPADRKTRRKGRVRRR
jgi:Exoribonuclease R